MKVKPAPKPEKLRATLFIATEGDPRSAGAVTCLLIASITTANNATRVTHNLKHFRQVPGLKVVNWVD